MEQDLNNWFTFLALAVACAALWTGLVSRREDQRLDAIEVLERVEKKRSMSRKFFTQARRRAQAVLASPPLEVLGGLTDVATDWLEAAADIEANHDELVEEAALVRDSLHRRRRFDLGRLKALECSLDGLLELTAVFLELVEAPVDRLIGDLEKAVYSSPSPVNSG